MSVTIRSEEERLDESAEERMLSVELRRWRLVVVGWDISSSRHHSGGMVGDGLCRDTRSVIPERAIIIDHSGKREEEENSLSVELEIPMDEKALSGARNRLSKTTLFRQTLPHA